MTNAIEQTMEVLTSTDTFSLPDKRTRKKWSGPWWHLATLFEMGEAKQIPESTANRALELLKQGAWPKFVITREDAPKSDVDKTKMDCCHCELGVFYQILSACGCDVDNELPWMRKWFLKHQLPDGGLNCTPSAYKHSQKSSIVSTLPPLEAILFCTKRDFTPAEEKFLDEGARYLIEHQLVRSKKKGNIINKEWLKPLFPRFFEYDILRGLFFLVEWSKRREKPLPTEEIEEGLEQLKSYIKDSEVIIGRQVYDSNGNWGGDTFPLLNAVSEVGSVSPYLTKEFNAVISFN
jgi:hypothetical protein